MQNRYFQKQQKKTLKYNYRILLNTLSSTQTALKIQQLLLLFSHFLKGLRILTLIYIYKNNNKMEQYWTNISTSATGLES